MPFGEQEDIVSTIKKICFDTQDIDPQHLDRSVVIDAQNKHRLFIHINEEHFFSLFKRAASEWILDQVLSNKKTTTSDATKSTVPSTVASTVTNAGEASIRTRASPCKPKMAANQTQKKATTKIEVMLPNVINPWVDNDRHGPNERVHIFAQLLSGACHDHFHIFNTGQPASLEYSNGMTTTVVVPIKVNPSLYDADRMLSHPFFDNYIDGGHDPMVAALKMKTDAILGESKHAQYVAKFTLQGTYDWTPEGISGHNSIVPFELDEEDETGESVVPRQKVFIVMFDLMKRKEKQSFAQRKKSPLRVHYDLG